MNGKDVWLRGREREREVMGPSYFLSGPTTIQSLKNGEKMREKRKKS